MLFCEQLQKISAFAIKGEGSWNAEITTVHGQMVGILKFWHRSSEDGN